jgi:hypothetical protein
LNAAATQCNLSKVLALRKSAAIALIPGRAEYG